MSRDFNLKPATRESVPLLVGLIAPSGGGKTFSGLRLATGIQRVIGGDIGVVDTESKRALHYADKFKFKHLEFKQPFGSLDYLEAIKYVAAQGCRTIMVDSMSHEHEGPGGYLMTHAAEIERMSRGDPSKADKLTFAAWIKPASERRQLINGLLQIDANMIFCFRAKEKLKLERGKDPLPLGWMPIAGEEFIYEQTVCALLYPGAKGVPTWNPTMPGERAMMKLPEQFLGMIDDGKQMSEEHGQKLAEWAKGTKPRVDRGLADLAKEGDARSLDGVEKLKAWWQRDLSAGERTTLGGNDGERLKAWKEIAAKVPAA